MWSNDLLRGELIRHHDQDGIDRIKPITDGLQDLYVLLNLAMTWMSQRMHPKEGESFHSVIEKARAKEDGMTLTIEDRREMSRQIEEQARELRRKRENP